MKKEPNIVIVGATGLVGSEMLITLEQLNVPYQQVRLLASEDSAGEVYKLHDDELEVETLSADSFDGADIALFATSAELSEKFVPVAVEAGAIVIDNSSRFRMEPGVPLVVPEVNFDHITNQTKIIANPNCSTIQLVPVLKGILDVAGLKHVVVSTYQSVSGAGKAALDELWSQCLAVFNQQEVVSEAFQHQIAFNCIPQIDILQDDGFTREESKIMNESRKILGLPSLRITATAVRVPVFYGHSESVFIETDKAFKMEEIIETLKKRTELTVFEDGIEFPMPLDAAGSDSILVGRIRRDPSVENGLSLWIVADNVRKGAALNAVQIADRLIREAK